MDSLFLVGQWSPRSISLALARSLSSDPRTVGKVELTYSHLPAGNAFAIRLVRKAKSGGQTSVTLVGFFNATSAYTMTFLVPVKHANSYRSEFNDTARTFRLVE